MIDGRIRGNVIRHSTVQVPAPALRAASSNEASTELADAMQYR